MSYIVLHFTNSLSGKWGPLPGQDYGSRTSSATQSNKFMVVLLSCFRNPPNSDMDYMTFHVRTCMIVLVRVYANTRTFMPAH